MKFCLIILIGMLILTAPGGAVGQPGPPRRCGTVAYNEALERSVPGLAAYRNQVREKISELARQHSGTRTLVTIPVVVHVLWNQPEQNISNDQVYSQIISLNQDFRRLNPDTIHTPAMFDSVAADSDLEFCLARRTPDSLPSFGILRVETSVPEFPVSNQMKNPFEGGSRAWDSDRYLNIWVCKLQGNYLGFAQMPGGPDSTDGVVIDYRCFGSTGDLNPHYNKGRTATHEIGHWLDLYHIWGDDFGACTGSDYVDDTPNAADANYFCPTHPHTTVCNSTGEMFMNYMDYVDDICFNLFTEGQADRMHAALAAYRPGLLTSDGCVPVTGLEEAGRDPGIEIRPNPASTSVTLNIRSNHHASLTITLVDMQGRKVYQAGEPAGMNHRVTLPVDALPSGIYNLIVTSPSGRATARLSIQH